MGKDYNGKGGDKYKATNKAGNDKGARRAVADINESSLAEERLVVRVTKKASDSGVEYHHPFDLKKLGINLKTARLYKLFNKEGIYDRHYEVERCFTNSDYVDSSDEEEEEDDEEEEDEEDEDASESKTEESKTEDKVEESKTGNKEALSDWVDVAKEVTAISEQAEAKKEEKKEEEASKSESKEEEEAGKSGNEDESEEEEEEEDDNPYRLIFEDKDGNYMDVDGNTMIRKLLKGGQLFITLK
ncbi:hypothetical protein IWW38_000626 [Coemansia aciculifera]|uniref:Uncharacterized protein n=1 Tax=Coemansia aciculifera TaxID=417176 RepID=A0ACC1M962_9FUNG|nr:hypothetical protein IWW38_000626 [Coemansia aciculifera]